MIVLNADIMIKVTNLWPEVKLYKGLWIADSRYYLPTKKEVKEVLKKDKINLRKFIDEIWDCDDFAYYVWVEAHKVGFLMSVETDYQKGELHALNSTIIGNNVYYIESQNGMIWLFCYRD